MWRRASIEPCYEYHGTTTYNLEMTVYVSIICSWKFYVRAESTPYAAIYIVLYKVVCGWGDLFTIFWCSYNSVLLFCDFYQFRFGISCLHLNILKSSSSSSISFILSCSDLKAKNTTSLCGAIYIWIILLIACWQNIWLREDMRLWGITCPRSVPLVLIWCSGHAQFRWDNILCNFFLSKFWSLLFHWFCCFQFSQSLTSVYLNLCSLGQSGLQFWSRYDQKISSWSCIAACKNC